MVSFTILALATVAKGAVNVVRTDQGPTGYEATMTYTNASVKSVKLGALPRLTDQYRTTFAYAAQFDFDAYKPGDFPAGPSDAYDMEPLGNGPFVLTRPFPSGSFQYHLLLDCENDTLCATETGQLVTDPENPPFDTVPGTETGSPLQVPYDGCFQYYRELNLDFDYPLPIAPDCRGTVKSDIYPSKGAVSPSPDMHHFAVYLPAEYNSMSAEPYPLLYLSHGGGGAAGD